MNKEGNKIKLVQVIADSGIGGGPNHVLGILRNIDKEKFECYLFCPAGYLANEARLISGVAVSTIRMKSKFDLPSILIFRSELSKIRATGDPFGPMIIHSHGPRASLMASLATPSGARQIYTEHIYGGEYSLKNPVNGWIQKTLLKSQNRKRDKVIAVSTSVKNYLIESGMANKEQVIIVPNGIDLDNSTIKTQKSKLANNSIPVIGAIGSLNKNKGFEYLIEAVALAQKKYPLVSAEIIGDGPEKQNLLNRIKDKNLSHNVSLLGSKTDIDKYLRHWKALVVPSISETFGIVVLEGMSAGVPVIATKVGGITDIITNKKNGILVEPKDPAQIARAIEEVLAHPVLAAKLKREGLARAKDFSLKDIVKKLERVYIALFVGGEDE